MILYGNIAWHLFQESNNKSPMTKAKTLEISFDLSMSNFVWPKKGGVPLQRNSKFAEGKTRI